MNIRTNYRGKVIDGDVTIKKKMKHYLLFYVKILLTLSKKSYHLIKLLDVNIPLDIVVTLTRINLNESFSLLALHLDIVPTYDNSSLWLLVVLISNKVVVDRTLSCLLETKKCTLIRPPSVSQSSINPNS